MSISGIGFGGVLLDQSIFSLKNQLADLQTQLTTGKKSTQYSGMGLNEGFAIAARAQLSNYSAYATTQTNLKTTISVANTAIDSFRKIANSVQSATGSGVETVNGVGQTDGQRTAIGQFASMLGILNTQAGDRYIFSGNAIDQPSVASSDAIFDGTATQAGLKQVIAERLQADQGTGGLGRLVITPPPPLGTTLQIAEDVAGSPFGLKLASISSGLSGATVTGPTGAPPAISISLAANPAAGQQVKFAFTLPDGSSETFTLTASTANPPPTGSFTIVATPDVTASNLSAALTTAVTTLANTALPAASAVAAGNDFFNWSAVASGSAVNNQQAPAAPVSGATALSGLPGSDSLVSGFAAGDSITVNGTQIDFVASGATGNQLNVTDNIQALLQKIDAITGTTTRSRVANGVITLNGGTTAPLAVSSSNAAAFAALGFGAPVNASLGPVRVSGSPLSSATAIASGVSNTVAWYTGEASTTNARASAVARIDDHVTVDYGVRANESAIRSALQAVATLACFTAPPTGSYTSGQIGALNQRITSALSQPVGAQTIADIQSDLANAQVTMNDARARQDQAQLQLQNMVENTEGISSNEVASQILALQTSLQASYQTTSMLAQLSLVKFL